MALNLLKRSAGDEKRAASARRGGEGGLSHQSRVTHVKSDTSPSE